MAVVHEKSLGDTVLITVDADPNGVITRPVASEARMTDGSATWMNLDGGTTWQRNDGRANEATGFKDGAATELTYAVVSNGDALVRDGTDVKGETPDDLLARMGPPRIERFVDPDNTNPSPNGSRANPFTSIQAAINDIVTAAAGGPGDRIVRIVSGHRFFAGFDEHVTIPDTDNGDWTIYADGCSAIIGSTTTRRNLSRNIDGNSSPSGNPRLIIGASEGHYLTVYGQLLLSVTGAERNLSLSLERMTISPDAAETYAIVATGWSTNWIYCAHMHDVYLSEGINAPRMSISKTIHESIINGPAIVRSVHRARSSKFQNAGGTALTVTAATGDGFYDCAFTGDFSGPAGSFRVNYTTWNLWFYSLLGGATLVLLDGHASEHEPGEVDALSTATAGAATPGDAAAEGTATSFARSDHKHSLPAYGSGAATFCQGNDARLSDARTPTSHAGSHAVGGADELTDVKDNLVDVVVACADATGGSEDAALTVDVEDLSGTALSKACVLLLYASTTQYGGPRTANANITMGSPSKGSILASSAANGWWLIKTDTSGQFAVTASNTTDETVYFVCATSDGGADAVANGVAVRGCVPDSGTWSA